MEMLFDKNLKLLQIQRPFIGNEETNQSFVIWQPEGIHYGLYDKNVPFGNNNKFSMRGHYVPTGHSTGPVPMGSRELYQRY